MKGPPSVHPIVMAATAATSHEIFLPRDGIVFLVILLVVAVIAALRSLIRR